MAYSEAKIAETLAVLAATGDNLKETARRTGVSRHTIKRWKNRDVPGGDADSVDQKSTHKKEELADRLTTWIDKLLDEALKEDRIKNAQYRDIVGAIKIAHEMKLNLTAGDDDETDTSQFTNALKQATKNIWSEPSEDAQ